MHVSTMPSTRMLIDSRDRANPASSITKPTCMQKTRNAASSTQTVLSALTSGDGPGRRGLRVKRRRNRDVHRRQQKRQTDGLAAGQREHVGSHVRVLDTRLQPFQERSQSHLSNLLIAANAGRRNTPTCRPGTAGCLLCPSREQNQDRLSFSSPHRDQRFPRNSSGRVRILVRIDTNVEHALQANNFVGIARADGAARSDGPSRSPRRREASPTE